MSYLFSVIVPVYQNISLFSIFWNSLLTTLSSPTQIILVNDASPHDTATFLRQLQTADIGDSTVYLIEHEKSQGYAHCVNDAMKIINAEYIVMMDSDIILTEGWQHKLESRFRDSSIGGIGSVLIYPQTGGVQCAGITYTDTVGRHLFLNADPCVLGQEPYDVQATVFAFFATRRSIVLQIGLMDTHFFNGYEDIDYQLRIRKLGQKIVIDPLLKNYHWEQSNGIFRDYGRRSNLALLWKKYGDFIYSDLWDYLLPHLRARIGINVCYDGIDLCSTRNDAQCFWAQMENILPNQVLCVYEYWHSVSDNQSVNLSMTLPFDSIRNSRPFLILCDHFIRLLDNDYWVNFRLRYCTEDIIADLYGNVLSWQQLQGQFWPGRKVR